MIDLNSLNVFYVVVSAGGYSAAHRKQGNHVRPLADISLH